MTLRARLILALLALALIPTAIFTIFTLDLLDEGVTRWYSPQVDRSLTSAREVTLTSLTRLEATVLTQSASWAAQWPLRSLTPQRRAEMSAALRASGIDFIQIYRRADGWTRIDEIVPEGVMLLDRRDLGDQLPDRLLAPTVVHAKSGALAAATPLPNGDALVAGMWVPPDFFTHVDRLARGMTYYPRLDVMARLWRGYLGLLVAGVVVMVAVIALLLASALARGMSRPLRDLSEGIERVAGGDLATRVVPAGAVEVRSLGVSFNAMSARLESSRDALQQAEREAAWRDVARKLAHEFKNLLTPMQLSLQLLESEVDKIPTEERKLMVEDLEAAMRQLGSLNRMAEQFSQYARLPEPRYESVDLTAVVRDVSRLGHHVPIQVESTGTPFVVRADPVLLSRAIHNLLINACEASSKDTAVAIRTSIDDGVAKIEILDRGSGLPEIGAERLFEPYMSTKKRGSGLGLSLVRDIALQHGGTVTLENRPGGGVRAVLAIPASQTRPLDGNPS